MIGKASFSLNGTTYQFELEDGDGLKLMHQLNIFGNPPMNCPYIKNGKYELETNKDDEGNIYVNMVCVGKNENGERAKYKAKLGTYRDKSGHFWNWWKEDEYYKSKVSGNSSQTTTDDGVPF